MTEVGIPELRLLAEENERNRESYRTALRRVTEKRRLDVTEEDFAEVRTASVAWTQSYARLLARCGEMGILGQEVAKGWL